MAEFGDIYHFLNDCLIFLITDFSDKIKSHFTDKNYGSGVKSFYICIISVPPEGEKFHPIRKKYTKSKKNIECDIKINYEKFKTANELEVYELLSSGILSAIEIISKMGISNFNIVKFSDDLEACLKRLRSVE